MWNLHCLICNVRFMLPGMRCFGMKLLLMCGDLRAAPGPGPFRTPPRRAGPPSMTPQGLTPPLMHLTLNHP